MILDGFRKTNVRKKITRELLKNNSLKADTSQKIDSILILVNENSIINLDQIISKRINIDVSKVATIFFKDMNGSDSNLEERLTEKDFSLFGNLKNEAFEKLIQTKFDLLLNYTEGNLYLNYVTAFSKAAFKVGLQYNQQQLFDLKIEVEKGEVDVFHGELVKYLKILNKI